MKAISSILLAGMAAGGLAASGCAALLAPAKATDTGPQWLALGPDQAPVDASAVTAVTGAEPFPDGVFRGGGDYQRTPDRVVVVPRDYPSPAAPHQLIGRFQVATQAPDRGLAEAKLIAAAHGANWLYRVRPTHSIATQHLNDRKYVPDHYVYFAVRLSDAYPSLTQAMDGLVIPDGYAGSGEKRDGALPGETSLKFRAEPGYCYGIAVALDGDARVASPGLMASQPAGVFFGNREQADDLRGMASGERASFRRVGCPGAPAAVELKLFPGASSNASKQGFAGKLRARVYAKKLTGAELEPIQRAYTLSKCNYCLGQKACLSRFKLSREKCSVARYGRR